MYTPLFVKSNYTFLSSLVRIEQLLQKCVEYNIRSIALCDDDMIATMYFYQECKKKNILPIIGIRLNYEENSLLLYAQNFEGYKNLIKLNTIKSERKIAKEDLVKHKEHVVAIVNYKDKERYEDIKTIYTYCYLGYKNFEEEKLSLKITSNVVFINEIKYVNKKDSKYYKYITMIRDKKNIMDDIEYKDDHNYLLSNEEVLNLSSRLGLDKTNFIASLCQVEFPMNQNLLPIYQNEFQIDNDEFLFKLSVKGLEKRLKGQVSEIYKNRLLYELKIIKDMGFSNYFLVVYDYVKYAKKNKILVGPGRGSAGGSLVAYSLGIIEIDPIKYDLLFERFLNPGRITMPDIDIDFPDIYRGQVIDYVKEKYGIKKVAGIVAIGTLKAKAALDDVARILKIQPEKIERLKRYIPFNGELKKVYESTEEFKKIIDNDERLSLLYEIATFLEGFPRNTTTHASGIIMSNNDLDEIIPLLKQDGVYVSGYEMGYLEQLGLLKMDFLGNRNLTMIMDMMENINKNEGVDLEFNQIALDDKDALAIFNNIDTNGIFQFESDVMKHLLRRLKPTTFEDIVAANALVRPGPVDTLYINRRHHLEPISYPDASLEPILKSTYGVIIYQEQIMLLANKMAGYTLSEADILRRAMGKKKVDILKQEEEKFISNSIKRGYSYEVSKEVYDLILNFAQYGFNKSHTVAYSVIAYNMAYLKAKYPTYFYISLLSMTENNDNKSAMLIKEARAKGINFVLPDINKSTDRYEVCEGGISFPLSNIKNVGSNNCQEIVRVRKEGFKDIYDCFIKLTEAKINRKVIEQLIKASSFRSLGYNNKTLMDNLDNLLTFAYIAKGLDSSDLIERPKIELQEEYPSEILMSDEKELFGFYLSHHPTTKYKLEYKIVDLEKIHNYLGRYVDIIVLVERFKTYVDKKGKTMAFAQGSDEMATIDLTIFSNVYEEYLSSIEITKGDILLLQGKIEAKNGYQMIVQKIKKLNI